MTSFSKGTRLVLGTAGLGGAWGDNIQEATSVDAILYGLEHGIKVVDTAPSYFMAEEFLGKALRQWSGEKPFVSTKVGRLKAQRADESYFDYSPGGMKKSVEKSLQTLGIDCLDLLFLHEPHVPDPKQVPQIVETLLQLREQGYTRMLGLGGNPPIDVFAPFLGPDVLEVVMGYNQFNAISFQAKDTYLPLMKEKNVLFYAASPLYMGLLGKKYNDYVQAPPEFIKENTLKKARALYGLAQQEGMPLASLAHRFLFSCPEPDRVVIGAANLQELKASLEDWESGALSSEIFQAVLTVAQKAM